MMLTTPAMASEPYCADAPSRRISIRPVASDEIWARSVACEPLLPRKAERWKRLPLTITRVMSGERLFRVAGRMNCKPSEDGRRLTSNEGTRVASAWSMLPDEVERTASADITSTGESAVNWVCVVSRVPVEMTSSGAAMVCALAAPVQARVRNETVRSARLRKATLTMKKPNNKSGGEWRECTTGD